MAKSKLIPVQVYMDEDQFEQLGRAASQDKRSLSNYLIVRGLEGAKALGLAEGKDVEKAARSEVNRISMLLDDEAPES